MSATEQKTILQVGVVHHRHGVTIYVAYTLDALYVKLRAYAEEWWHEWFNLQGVKIPADNREAVETYFNGTDGGEYCDIDFLEV